eukprot:jgi/Hompol1/6865/HPOL_004179-RA
MAKSKSHSSGPAKTHPVVAAWLVAYNFASLAGWAAVLFLLLDSLISTGGDFSKSYSVCGPLVSIVQLGAVMEVIHTLTGAVRSPIMTTAMQVSSRLFLVAVCYFFDVPEVRNHVAFSLMVFAWSVTEVIRYPYYGLNLLGINIEALVWARYTFFFVLYPLGAGSELWLAIRALDAAKAVSFELYAAMIVVCLSYPPGFYSMYTHMIKQRRKYLSGSAHKDEAAAKKDQ